jgi:hypothetical protein
VTNIRLQLIVSPAKEEEIQALMKACGTTRKDLLNCALTLLEWSVNELRAGKIIAAVDEHESTYTELHMPLFSAIKKTRS